MQSDTAVVRTGGGTGGSRSLQLGGNAVGQAADELREQGRRASRPGCSRPTPTTSCSTTAPSASPASPAPASRWPELAAVRPRARRRARRRHRLHPGRRDVPVRRPRRRSSRSTPRPAGSRPLRHIAVDDCGRILNPLLVAGQQHGGAIQGISPGAVGGDASTTRTGTPLTATFADYAMPTAADAITLEASNTETPTPLNPLGAKGIGESATIGVDARRAERRGRRAAATSASGTSTCPARPSGSGGRSATPPGRRPDLWREPPAAFGRLPRGDDAATPDVVEI